MLFDFRERERNIDVREKHWSVASCKHPNQDQTRNLGMGPDQESNLWLFRLRVDPATNWAALARAGHKFFKLCPTHTFSQSMVIFTLS